VSWYAVKTAPGAQLPQREYQVETTRSNKGYRIVPSLNPNVSAVERTLKENGFTFYMPAEKRLVRDRRRTDLWKVRRFALMVGYLFVKDPHDWLLLAETPGVAGVLRSSEGRPLEIPLEEILMVRAAEAQAEVEFDRASRVARQKLRRKAKGDARLQALVDRLDIAGLVSVGGGQ
jgi:transcription antitermination factor NusG